MRISYKRLTIWKTTFAVIADIRPQMLEKVIENWTSRLDYIRASRGNLLAPSNFSFVAITNISITLEWDAPEFSEKPIIAYQVRRSKTDAFEAADIYHTSTTKYTFAGLVPYTLYYFEVRASTETTVGPWSETLSQQTKVGVPFAPVGVSEEYVTNSSIAVKWKEPQPFCGPITLYTIQYSKKSDPTSFNDTIVEFANYTIENLIPYTEYSIQVRAKTEAGFGPWSAVLIVLTDVGIPSVPTDLVAINTTARSILLSWNAPDPANGPSLEYLMSWGVRGSSISQVLVLGTEFLADTLVPHKEYSFQVAAKTSAGLGPKSKRLYVWTKIDDGDRFNSCHSQFGLAIHQNDHQARRRFVEWAQNEIAVVPDFRKRILFSDEAHFWLNGYVNKQNGRIWSEANPHVYVETPLHLEKLTVWCALWAGGILLQKR
ncbi:receptor-type tyrosine-protein phosphatase delta [Trichonephila clavipes]|nr:receptor-type tyrosine-protein phosphatase delta [Trichonephila clavipes]